jgi:hypothetical protein
MLLLQLDTRCVASRKRLPPPPPTPSCPIPSMEAFKPQSLRRPHPRRLNPAPRIPMYHRHRSMAMAVAATWHSNQQPAVPVSPADRDEPPSTCKMLVCGAASSTAVARCSVQLLNSSGLFLYTHHSISRTLVHTVETIITMKPPFN